MRVELKYGRGKVPVVIPEGTAAEVLAIQNPPAPGDETLAIAKSLDSPLGCPPLEETLRPQARVAIVTSDITRPFPSAKVLPSLLERIRKAGVPDSNVTVVFALGCHRKHTAEEKRRLVGDAVFDRVSCIDSDPDDVVRMGRTSRGTPVDIFRPVAEADVRICLGNIEFHYFAGCSGGMKAIMPGVSTREAIQANHREMIRAEACAGRLEGNPVREDIEEAAGSCPVHFILNAVLGEDRRILGSFAGDAVKAHRAGCAFLDSLYRVRMQRPADVVLVSAGGSPKDINLYQAQKALDNAKQAVADGGTIILVAECAEGLGDEAFSRWILRGDSPQEIVARIHRTFELGGHKAAAIAMVRQRARISLVSGLPRETTAQCFMDPFPTVQEALDSALAGRGAGARVCIIPAGGSVLPSVGPKE
jgi:lactate racemase